VRSISREEADNHHPGYKGLGLDNVFYQTHLVLQLLPTSTISAYFDLTVNFWLNAIWATCGLPNKISPPPVTTNVVLFSSEIANKITLGHATDVVIAVAASIFATFYFISLYTTANTIVLDQHALSRASPSWWIGVFHSPPKPVSHYLSIILHEAY